MDGIGYGRIGSTCSNIKITGGKVYIRCDGEGAGIGGRELLKNVEISGGTVEIYANRLASRKFAIGASNVENVIIAGGNVYLHADNGKNIGTPEADIPPTDENGTEVLETILTIDGINKETPISNIEFSDYSGSYGLKDMSIRNNGKVYIYLPTGSKVVSITAEGKTYTAETPIEAGTSGTLSK